ncbi:MAG: AMP-binding protein [Deltaproteobacteria bacterium]|nr:AMP-binding protein [Deltaproteobacteria bacterium]MBN2688803.1 AMP-binding protein [Deltaproteobacteria bacterium]
MRYGEEMDREIEYHRYTVPQILALQAARIGTKGIALREKAYGIWKTYNWKDYLDYVRKAGLGLISLGMRRGEYLGIITDNNPEWLFSEIGGQAVGAVTLNLFTSAVADELAHTLNRIRASFVIAQDQEQVDKLLEVKNKLPSVKQVIYIDQTGMRSYQNDPWLVSFRDLLGRGDEMDGAQPGLFDRELSRGRPDDIAVMIMTSGTTGMAKLAMLSHRNITAMAEKWRAVLPQEMAADWISLSPPAWIVDQMWGAGVSLVSGSTMNFPEMTETITEDFRDIGPAVIITSSRFWEDLASTIRVKMSDAGIIKRKLFSICEKIGERWVDLESTGKPIPLSLRVLRRWASVVMFKPLLDRVGCSRIATAFTGGHPISPEVIRFFRSFGLNLKQCYGLTEAGGIFQVQPDHEVKAETVGKPLPGTEVKISDDQEVLVSSPSNFMGYYQDYQATDGAFSNGWLRTGDAGYLDDDGHLVIIGRKEEIIRNKEGHAFSPDFIETRLKFSPYIKEAVTFGEGRPYITALVNIDMGNVGNWAEDRMIPYTTYTDLSQQRQVEDLVMTEVDSVNERLPDYMKIRKMILLYKLLDADDEELTRTGKVRRRFVYSLYLKLIEAMYSGMSDVSVTSKVRYRDGQTNTLETTVRVLELREGREAVPERAGK